MGKIRTRILGDENIEEKQKKEQKEKSVEKKKIRAQGLKGGERMAEVEVDEKSVAKMEKAKEIMNAKDEPQDDEKESKRSTPHVRGKKYQKAMEAVTGKKTYSLAEAIGLLKKIKFANFDESVELHMNVDMTGLKGEAELPYSTGKTIRVRIVDDKTLADIELGKFDFDILITHPSFMPKLAKYARVLGPKGLMPNPKAGTISPNPEEVAKKFAKGALRWKTEAKFPLIHQIIGKISADENNLAENAKVFIASVGKGHIQQAFIKTTMSPGLKIDLEKV